MRRDSMADQRPKLSGPDSIGIRCSAVLGVAVEYRKITTGCDDEGTARGRKTVSSNLGLRHKLGRVARFTECRPVNPMARRREKQRLIRPGQSKQVETPAVVRGHGE